MAPADSATTRLDFCHPLLNPAAPQPVSGASGCAVQKPDVFSPAIPLSVNLPPLVVELRRCEHGRQAAKGLRHLARGSGSEVEHEDRRDVDQRELFVVEEVSVAGYENQTVS